jgi:hypothetical protein
MNTKSTFKQPVSCRWLDKLIRLTSEYNKYDQQGEYFLAWFHEKPTPDELQRSLETLCEEHDNEIVAHVLNGGGRRKFGKRWDECWFYLREVSSANVS